MDSGKLSAMAPSDCSEGVSDLFCEVEMVEDIYESQFYGHPHVLLLASHNKNDEVKEIYAVHSVVEGGCYRALRIHKRGTALFLVDASSLQVGRKTPTLAQQLAARFSKLSSEAKKQEEQGGRGTATAELSSTASNLPFSPAVVPANFSFAAVTRRAYDEAVQRVRLIEHQHPQTRRQTKMAFIFSTADDPCGRECDKSFASASGKDRSEFERVSQFFYYFFIFFVDGGFVSYFTNICYLTLCDCFTKM